jgi:hypothetical protein
MKIRSAHKKLTKLLRKAAQAAPPPDAGVIIIVDDGINREEITFKPSRAANPLENLLAKNN